MQFAAISIVIIGVLAYIWASRGFFSALLHMACTVAAGAIAFAAWEPLANLILAKAPTKAGSVWMVDVAWGVALAVPFLASLALIRVGMDKFIKANAKCSDTVDFVGGLACGLGSGIITAGIVVMSLGMLRFKPEMLGYASVSYTDNAGARGQVQRVRPVLRPYADEITGKLYTHLSNTAFRPIMGEPLAKWYPNVADVPSTMRMTFDGKARNTIRPDDALLVGAYTVGDPAGGQNLSALIRPQAAIDLSGQTINQGYVAGYVVNFRPGAREKSAQVVFGAGQVRLLCDRGDDTTDEVHPVAVISMADPSRPNVLGRWRYDAADTFISSIGGASEAQFAFEFAVPAGWSPLALYIKNARIDLSGLQVKALQSLDERDREIANRFGGVQLEFEEGAGDAGTYFKFPVPLSRAKRRGEVTPDEIGLRQTTALGFAMRKGAERGLSIVEDESGRTGWSITEGEETYSRQEIAAQVGTIDQKIRISKFALTSDVVMLQINVSKGMPLSLIGEAGLSADRNAPASVTDTDGQRYECVGYVYKDDLYHKVRYTPSRPVSSISELPELTVSKPDATLVLLFRVNFGVKVNRFMVGGTVIGEWPDTPLTMEQRSR